MVAPVLPAAHATTGATAPRGAAGRVVTAQRQAQRTLRWAVAFCGAAAVAAAVPHDTGAWLPLHLFLAGGLVLAISGASLLLTVTWSAAPAPGDAAVAAQRVLVVAGAAGLAVSREAGWPSWALGASGGLLVAGEVALAVLLVATVRRGVQRRFDVAVRWYATALGFAVAAGLVGVALGTGHHGGLDDLRSAHVALNLLGFVGLVIGGTLPFFVPTEARVKMAPRAEPGRLAVLLAWQGVAVLVAVTGLGTGTGWLAATGLAGYLLGLVALVGALPRLGAKQWSWAGPRLAHLLAGVGWWAAGVLMVAVAALGGDGFGRRPVVVIAVFGFGQVLWGSLAYLLPVVRAGGHVRLAAGFATLRSWPGLVVANLAAVAFVAGAEAPAAVLGAAWVADALVRVVAVSRPARAQPLTAPDQEVAP